MSLQQLIEVDSKGINQELNRQVNPSGLTKSRSLDRLIQQKQKRLYYIQHIDTIKERQKDRNKRNRTTLNKYQKKYYKSNKEKEILRTRNFNWMVTYLKKLCPMCSATYLQKGRLICYGCEMNL